MSVKKIGTETSTFGSKARSNHNSSKFYDSKLYKTLDTNIALAEEDNNFPLALENTILLKSSEKMTDIPNNSIHLMLTSPPYNVSKDYDNDLSLKEYLSLLEQVFSETHRVLVNGGRACINIANIGRKPYIPLSSYITQIMLKIGFLMRGEIIWNKASSASPSVAWGSWKSASNPTLRDVHEYILVFSKGDYKREGDKSKNTINSDEFTQWTKSIWTFKTESAKRIDHPAPFPEELPNRLINLYSFADDMILDPFMGSGTTAVVAIKNKRKYIGYEINEEYKKLAENRINSINLEFNFSIS